MKKATAPKMKGNPGGSSRVTVTVLVQVVVDPRYMERPDYFAKGSDGVVRDEIASALGSVDFVTEVSALVLSTNEPKRMGVAR